MDTRIAVHNGCIMIYGAECKRGHAYVRKQGTLLHYQAGWYAW